MTTYTVTRDDLFTADARTTSSAEFLDAIGPLFGKPESKCRAEQIERDHAWREHQDAMRSAPRDYWERRRHEDACAERYAARLREIAERYAERIEEKPLGDGWNRWAA